MRPPLLAPLLILLPFCAAWAVEPSLNAPAPVVLTAAPGEGVTLASADGRYALNLRARIQMRDTFQRVGGLETNELSIRTARLQLRGHVLAPELKWAIQLAHGTPDFESLGPAVPVNVSPIFDAYLEYTGLRDLNVRVGQFFVPFDRARTIREFALQFAERQQVVRELTLDRDVGLMLSSSDLFGLGGRFGYDFFLGSGDGRNRPSGQRLGPLVVLRLTVRPFGPFDDDREADLSRQRRPRLAVGVAAAHNRETTRQYSTYGAIFQTGAADYSSFAVDGHFKYAGFSFLAEALWRSADADSFSGRVGEAVLTEWTRSGRGYFVQAGQLLTERLEVVGRWEELRARKGTDPAFAALAHRQGRQVGGGVNLYFNGHALKVQATYLLGFGRERGPDARRHVAHLLLDATM